MTFTPSTSPVKKKAEQKKACVSRQDAQDAADNIDPWLPLKNFLCLTDFSSFGLYALQNESQVPVKMSTWGWSPHLLHTHTHMKERDLLSAKYYQLLLLLLFLFLFLLGISFSKIRCCDAPAPRLLRRGAPLNFDQNALLAGLREEATRRTSLPAAAICIFWSLWLQVGCQNLGLTFLMSRMTKAISLIKKKKSHMVRLCVCVCVHVGGWDSAR